MYILLFLIILIILSSVAVSYLYFNQINQPQIKANILIPSFWIIIFLCTLLISSNLAHIGLIFNPQSPDIDFMQTIDSNYMSFFMLDLLYIIIGIAIYWFITRKFKIAPYWFLVGLVILVIYMYYPGIPSADGDTSYSQYQAHVYTDFQPPLFTLWWNIFHVKSAAFLMNTLFYYGGLIYISYFLRKCGKNWQNDLLVLFCLNPLLFTQLAIIWKDISFTGFLIDSIACYLALRSIKDKKIIYRVLWSFYFLFLFLATGFRLNGALPVLPFVFFGIYEIFYNQSDKSKRLKIIYSGFIALVIIIIFFTTNLFIAYKVFDATPSNVQSDVMLANLVAMECMSDHSYQIDIKYFKPSADDSREIFCNQVINYYNNDAYYINWSGTGVNIVAPHTESGEHEVKMQWIAGIKQHPFLFMLYRAKYFTNVLFYNYWYPTGTLTESPDIFSQIATSEHKDMKIELDIFLIAGTISVIFICLYFSIYSLSFMILISSLLQLISLYFLMPNHSVRYFFWDYIATVLAMVFLTINIKPKLKGELLKSSPSKKIVKRKKKL